MDPFALPDPFRSLGSLSRRPVAAFPPLDEPEADSAIARLTAGTLGGLGYVGSLQDKLGGRAVRGLLGGKPRELLSLVPFSDSLGITDPADVTSGEDLWRQIGYDPARGNWLERNLVGPALEVGLDPTTYLGGIGALTAAGKAARMGGTLTKGFLPAVRAGQRSLIYGGNDLIPGLLTGKRAADVAEGAVKLGGKALDLAEHVPLLGAGVRLGREAVPHVRSLFDVTAGPVANPTVQAAHGVERAAKDFELRGARGQAFDLYQDLQPILDAGANPDDVWRYLTETSQLGLSRTPAPTALPHAAELDQVAAKLRSLYDAMPSAERGLGLKSATWSGDFDLDYMRERMVKAGPGGGGWRRQVFGVAGPSQLPRQEIFDLPGGRVQLEDYIRDPRMSGAGRAGLRGVAPDVARKQVRDEIWDDILTGAQQYGPVGMLLDPQLVRRMRARAGGLAKYLGDVRDEFVAVPGRAEPAVPFFQHNVIGNFLERATQSAGTKGAARAVHNVIGRVGAGGAGGVPVLKVLKDAKLKGVGAYESALKALRQDPDQLLQQAYQAAGGPIALDPNEIFRQALKGFNLPEAEAKAVTKYINRYMTPEEVGFWKGLADSGLNLGKTGLYAIWPASHARNLTSGVWENLVEGTAPWNRAYSDARALRAARGIESGLPHLAGLSPAEQTRALQRELFVQGIIGQPLGEMNQRVGIRLADVGTGNPALPRKTVAEAARPWLDVGGALRDPLGVAGVGGRTVDTNPWVRAGRDVGTAVEEDLRIAQYLDRRRKGFTPESTTAAVHRTHFNYADLTDFEKTVMKRVFPFYTFSRFNLPKQFRRAFEEPLKTSIPLRVAAQGRAQGGYVPEYLRSGLAIPVGDEGDGTQRYLSQVGLPFEEAFSRLKLGATPTQTLAKTGLGLLGNVRGDVGSLLEYVTGKDFFTGRDLADLRPGKVESLGGLLDEDTSGFLSQALQATPASRMVGTLNRMLDERKGLPTKLLSLASGARLTDVDVDKWRAVDARRALEDLMQRSRRIRESTDYWIPKEQRAQATPDEASMLELYAALKQRARRAVDEQRRVGVRVGGG